MAFALKKQDKVTRDEIAQELRATGEALSTAIVAYNEAIELHNQFVEPLIDAYNEAVDRAVAFVTGIGGREQDTFDERTERWQYSDKGLAVQEWINSYRDAELEEINVELPEPFEQFDASNHAGIIEDLTDAVDE